MQLTRRDFTLMASAALLSESLSSAVPQSASRVGLVLAPSNLGLRTEPGRREPGTWRAPQVLLEAGLAQALNATEVISLERPQYESRAQPGTRIRNGQSIRAFSLRLSKAIHDLLQRKQFPVVVGGDCSILLGSLHGLRLAGGRGLVHVDGHSDFFHPKNYDTTKALGAAAGMDLALASGRGEPLLTQWADIEGPLVSDADVIQIGERDAEDPNFAKYYGDILQTEITQFTIQRVLAQGVEATARAAIERLAARGVEKAWLHVDLDVLDQSVMPAVDSPGSPGFTYAQLASLARALCASGRIAGANFAIYDPDRDSRLQYAKPLVSCIAGAVGAAASTTPAVRECCSIFELRQYTLHAGQRDVLIDLFDREFVETQEALGMRIMGQFRDADDPDRFVWIRAFPDMQVRKRALTAFYQGPVWKAHGRQAGQTMIDSDNVMLLHPVYPSTGFDRSPSARAPVGASAAPSSIVGATVYPLTPGAARNFPDFFREVVGPALRDAGIEPFAAFETESASNNYPQLPVREGEHVFVWFASFESVAAHAAAQQRLLKSQTWAKVNTTLSTYLESKPQQLRLHPTARSLLR